MAGAIRAMDQGASPEIVAWHRSTTGRTLYAWKPHADPAVRMPDFRSWETVIRLRQAGIRDLAMTAGAIGKPVAAEFTAFESLADKIPTPDQVRLDPSGSPVPNDPSALYLVTTMLGSAGRGQGRGAILHVPGPASESVWGLLARDLFRRLGGRLSGNPAWVNWYTENQALFAV